MKLSIIQKFKNLIFVIRGDDTVTADPETQVAFKNCAPFTKCITKIDGTAIDDAEDLNLVMPNIVNDNYFKSFNYKAKLLRNTQVEWNSKKCNNYCPIKLFK